MMRYPFVRAAALSLLFTILFKGGLSAQNPIADRQALEARFPHEQCLAQEEKINYTFTASFINRNAPAKEEEDGDNHPAAKEKTPLLYIDEETVTSYFTTSDKFSRINSIYYDAYSKINLVKCTENSMEMMGFPIIYTNYESEGVFYDDLQICAFSINMKKGKVYTSTFKKTYNDPHFFTKIYFNKDVPVGKKTITFNIPDWVDLEVMPINFEGFGIVKKEEPAKDGKPRKLIYEVTNLHAWPRESHAPGVAQTFPHLLLFVKSVTKQNIQTTFFKTHDDVYAWAKKLADEVVNDTATLKPVFKKMIGTETDSLKIIEKVFYWVQDHVRYIAFEDGVMGYKPMSANKVCDMLYGDCKGKANLCKNLLKLYGFDARLTWIGTTDIPYNPDLPTLAVYNHMICTVYFRGKTYFLDATEDYVAMDDYAERIQGQPVMIENGATYKTDHIPAFGYERNLQYEKTEMKLIDNKLLCSSHLEINGEQKTRLFRQMTGQKTKHTEASFTHYLKGSNSSCTILHVTPPPLDNRSEKISINYDFELTDAVFRTDHQVLVFPEVDHNFESLEMDSTRTCDYVFNNKYLIQSQTTVAFPAGYVIHKLPEPVVVKNGNYEFSLSYEQTQTGVCLKKQLAVKNSLLKKADFKTWNEDVDKLRKFYHSPLIFEKA
jgi:hypothetical protein